MCWIQRVQYCINYTIHVTQRADTFVLAICFRAKLVYIMDYVPVQWRALAYVYFCAKNTESAGFSHRECISACRT